MRGKLERRWGLRPVAVIPRRAAPKDLSSVPGRRPRAPRA